MKGVRGARCRKVRGFTNDTWISTDSIAAKEVTIGRTRESVKPKICAFSLAQPDICGLN